MKKTLKTLWETARATIPTYLMVISLLAGILVASTAMAKLSFPNGVPNIPSTMCAPNAYAQGQSYTLQTIVKILGEIRNFILIVGVIFIVIMIVWAGISYVTAGGDEEQTEAAKGKLIGALIGAAIILAAFALIATVSNIIENRSLVNTTNS